MAVRTALRYLRPYSAALRLLLVFTVILGVVYPLLVTGIAQVPGLHSRADGSMLNQDGRAVASRLIGQSYTDASGAPEPRYFQSRPSAAGSGYDPTASAASNLGPESIVDVLPDPKTRDGVGKPALLSQVCSRSVAIGKFDGVSGARPFCTSTGVGAVLAVRYAGPGYAGRVTAAVSVNQECPAIPFILTYQGVPVTCAMFGADYASGRLVPIRGSAPAHPSVPPDAVTASGSGLDPDISPAYAAIQCNRVAGARGLARAQVETLVRRYTTGRTLGFMGERVVNVVELNAALDRLYPRAGR